MLIESLLAVAMLAFVISMINQVVLSKIKRLHSDTARLEIMQILNKEMNNPKSTKEKSEKIDQSVLGVSNFAVTMPKLNQESSIFALKDFIQPVKIEATRIVDNRTELVSLWGITILEKNIDETKN